MQTLFSPDSLFMRTMGRIGGLLLNLLFLLTSIPIVTIGAVHRLLQKKVLMPYLT